MSAQHTPGDTVYSEEGQEAEFVAQAGGEFIVRPIYEDEDGPQFGDIRTWTAVFRTPPAPKLDAKTAAAEQRLAKVRGEVREFEARRNAFDLDEKARMERLKQHDQLAELDRYLAGELTHYVAVHEYYPSVEVIPVGETVESYGNSNGYGVLHLCPTRSWDKKVRWTVTYRTPDRWEYSKTKTVVPCCGEEAARAKAAEILSDYLDQYRDMDISKRSYAKELVNSCRSFGVDVPQWLLDGINLSQRMVLEQSISDQRTKLAEAEASLVAITQAAGADA